MATRLYNEYKVEGDCVTLLCHNSIEGIDDEVFIDLEDFDKVYNNYGRWRITTTNGGLTCLKASTLGGYPRKTVQLARVVSGAGSRDKIVYLDGNPLNCRKSNIQIG